MKKRVLVHLLWPWLVACGHDGGDQPMDGGTDAAVYPAFAPDVPQVVSVGGPVMDTPKAVAVTFASDALVGDLEAFVGGIGATSYWAATTAEYGVAPLVALPPIRLTETAPTAITDDQIQAWLKGKLDGTHPEFPPPGRNTVYSLFYPSTTTITEGGAQSCQAFGGYHNSTFATDGTPIVYAVLPRCSGGLKRVTLAGSHELIEAATDPQPIENPAYLQVDDGHAVWARLTGGGGETGDMCETLPDAATTVDGFSYTVQRSWSNAAARAGQDPCVPAPAGVYFNSAPTSPTVFVPYVGFTGAVDTQGWILPVGTPTTLTFEIYSTGPTAQPITLSAIDVSAERANKTPTLSFSFDKTAGYNGDSVQLVVKPLAPSSSQSGVTTFEVRSQLGTVTHSWLGVVQAK